MEPQDYLRWLREKVGHALVFLNFAGGCIRHERGEVLLQRRADRDVWGFPGGAMELGESAQAAAVREIREETGLEVEPEGLIGIYTDYYDEYPNGDKAQTILFFFELKVVGGRLSERDHETLELKWFPPDKMPPLVNRQHEDAWRDGKENRRGVVR